MCYLHNRGIIHRDIKPANVLLSGKVSSGQFDVKVTDFGVATDTNSVEDRTAETGTYRWMAPEVIRHEAYSQTADVYSFSILMWQLLTREDPFEGKSQIEAAAAVAMESARPPFHAETPDSIVRLIQACWSDDPRKRLPFDKISETLASIESTQLSEDERRWIEAPLGHSVYRRAGRTEPRTAPNWTSQATSSGWKGSAQVAKGSQRYTDVICQKIKSIPMNQFKQ
jgi:serine/threonine protein kinase